MIQEPRYKKLKQENDMNWESLCHSKKMTSLFTANERGKGGVAVIWKNNSVETKIQDLRITEIVENEAILCCFTMGGEAYAVCNIYASSANVKDERGVLFRGLAEKLPQATIIGGDFNMVLDTVQDLHRVAKASEYSNGAWDDLMVMSKALGIRDGWREQVGPHKVVYTHTVYNNKRQAPSEPGEDGRESEVREEVEILGPVTCQSRIDFVLSPDPEVISPLCHMEFGHDHILWAGQGQADHVATTLKLTQGEEQEDDSQGKREIFKHLNI